MVITLKYSQIQYCNALSFILEGGAVLGLDYPSCIFSDVSTLKILPSDELRFLFVKKNKYFLVEHSVSFGTVSE